MHTLLEAYLDQVAAQLSALPPKRREEELREMRQHLLNAVTVNQELGQSKDEAAANAVMQFGTPEAVGQDTMIVWKRGQELDKRSLWGAAACTLAVLAFVPLLVFPLERPYFNPLGATHLSTGDWLWGLFGFRFAGPILAGATASILFSKRAVLGSLVGAALYFAVCMPASMYQLDPSGSFNHAVSIVMFSAKSTAQDGLVILPIAWLVSRWRLAWNKRARLAKE